MLSRREILRGGLAGAGLLAGSERAAGAAGLEAVLRAATTCPPGAAASLADVGHVVILMQENRSFDHVLGTYRGTRGFADHPPGQLGAFSQAFPANTTAAPTGWLLPFHFDTATTNAACTNDITHEWGPQHDSWNGGAMDSFVAAHVAADGAAAGTATMGYYTRADLPFTYALADAFTVCDRYFSSTMAPTYPNRLYSMSATIDPGGRAGGPVVTNPGAGPGSLSGIYSWTTMPERLQAAGVTWKVYSQASSNNNMLPLFKRFLDPTSPLFARGVLPTWPADFDADVAAGTLPQVSWVLAPMSFDEHPPAPIGLGFRVPMIVASPFSRGGLVCSDVFDHTSLLRFLETRFGVEVPNLSAWRRGLTGDLTSSLDFASPADASVPVLPPTSLADPKVTRECMPGVVVGTVSSGPNYPLPPTQSMPGQEPGPPRRRPSGRVAAAACGPTGAASGGGGAAGASPGSGATLPATGRTLSPIAGLAAMGVGLGLSFLRRRARVT